VRVLDLFAGTKGWSDPFARAGHDTFTVELDTSFWADAYLDVNDTEAVLDALPWRPDVILASPPCNSFSVASMGKMWTHDGEPKHPTAVQGRRNVLSTPRLVAILNPSYWVMENPRGRLRTLELTRGIDRRTVTYCQLGEDRMKPTDLFGHFPPDLYLPKPCKNGDPCHIAAPRGSRTGTQGGVNARTAGMIPSKLSELFRAALEVEEQKGWPR